MPPTTIQEDLAYLRDAVGRPGEPQAAFGKLYLAAGLLYGVQLAGHWSQATGRLVLSPDQSWALGIGPTLVFIGFSVWVAWRQRGRPSGGLTNRAVNAVFGACGAANLALAAVIGAVAFRERSLTIWLIFPCAVFVLQGVAWYVAFLLRRRLWLGAVALGWTVTAVAMALHIGSPVYMLIAGFGLVAWMAVPGAIVLRLAQRDAAG